MDDDVATKRVFMGNWVREIKWDWVWKSACKEGKCTLQGLASTITLCWQIDGIYAALANGMQCIASTKSQINYKTCRL